MEINDSSLLIEPSSKEALKSPKIITANESSNSIEVEQSVDWKEEALKGNFMPAVIKLDRNEIHVDDIVDPNTGNRLVHLATYKGFLNVVRTLHETFKCDISIKNNFGHSALHLLCSRFSLDLHLFYFLIKYDPNSLDLKDSSNVSPLFYCVMSKQNVGFLYLLSLGADPYILDKFENNILFWALTHNNLFAVKFILNNLDIDLDSKFYKINPTISKDITDLLICSKNTASCKYICKYLYTKINLDSLKNMIVNLDKSSFYNIKNFEILSMVYHYKSRLHLNLLAIFNVFMNLNFSYYCFNFYLTLFVKETKATSKLLILVLFGFIKFYFLSDMTNSFNIFPSMVCIALLVINFILTVKLFFFSSKVKIQNSKSLNEENVLNEVNQVFKTNLFSMFFEEEICEICLIRKDIYTIHCKTCNKCVENFHFHSIIFNNCISMENMRPYFLYEATNLFICILLIVIFYYWVNEGYPRNNYYLITNLMYMIVGPSFKHLVLSIYIFISMIYSFQVICVLLVCLGYKTTYHMLFRNHKIKNHYIQMKNKMLYFTVDTNKYTFFQAIFNIFKNF